MNLNCSKLIDLLKTWEVAIIVMRWLNWKQSERARSTSVIVWAINRQLMQTSSFFHDTIHAICYFVAASHDTTSWTFWLKKLFTLFNLCEFRIFCPRAVCNFEFNLFFLRQRSSVFKCKYVYWCSKNHLIVHYSNKFIVSTKLRRCVE